MKPCIIGAALALAASTADAAIWYYETANELGESLSVLIDEENREFTVAGKVSSTDPNGCPGWRPTLCEPILDTGLVRHFRAHRMDETFPFEDPAPGYQLFYDTNANLFQFGAGNYWPDYFLEIRNGVVVHAGMQDMGSCERIADLFENPCFLPASTFIELVDVQPVPLPATALLLFGGLVGVAAVRKRAAG